jgi:Prolipoprotein diacylglyceryl transferase
VEFTLLWAVLTAVGFLWIGTRVWPDGLADRPVEGLVGAAAVGLLIGRLTEMLLQGTNPLTNLGEVLIVRGGIQSASATLAAVLAYLWGVRGEIRFLDAAVPAALLGLAGWHGGCVWRGACLGTVSELPWAWAEPGSLVTRHPVELYLALAVAAAAWGASRLSFRPWLRSGIGLAMAGGIRLLFDPLRLSLAGGPTGWYLTAIGIGLLAAILGPRLPARHIGAVT